MKTALDFIGDLRAATSDLERAHVLLSTRGMPRWEDLRAVAEGYDRDVLSIDRLVQWSTVTDADGCTDRYEGRLTVAGVELAVPDMETVTRRWSTRPGWYVLDLWERDSWVRSVDGAPYRDAPRRCLEAVDAYHRGEATTEHVQSTRRLAVNAGDAATNAAAFVAYGAVYAACVDNADAAYAAYYAADYAAYDVAAYSAYARANGSARIQERARWHADWRWHLVHDALQGSEE